MNQFFRTKMLLGEEGLNKLNNSTVAIFGLGGVGSYVVEGLARCGIGHLILIDKDIVDITNINRQIIALHSTLGKAKVDIAKKRIIDINPNADVITYKMFYSKEQGRGIIDTCDYVVDAIDSITSKLTLIEECKQKRISIISSMGTANKLNPTLFQVSDIFNTSVCPMCRVMRQQLKKRNIDLLKVVYSTELPIKPVSCDRQILGSVSFVPSVVGLIIASEVVKDIISN